MAEKVGDRWVNPFFSGVSLDDHIDPFARSAGPRGTFEGFTGSQLVKDAWYGALVGNPGLSRDSDADGLTDIEEVRLGTDPSKADSDSDGDPDGVDPWPNAPHRLDLSHEEQILAAAFEARFHFNDRARAPPSSWRLPT